MTGKYEGNFSKLNAGAGFCFYKCLFYLLKTRSAGAHSFFNRVMRIEHGIDIFFKETAG